MRRTAPAVAICVFIFALAGLAQGQTCNPPTITLIGGTSPSCPGQPVTLDAGNGWTSYQWSPGGGTTQMISDAPNATTSYTVTTTDANGCTVTSQPYTVTVSGPLPAAPDIHLMYPSICRLGSDSASIDAPASGGNWSSISWTVDHGTISSGQAASYVYFTADGSGQPLHLTVTVQDATGCPVTSSADIPIRAISAPPIQVMYPTMCANGYNNAYINGPTDGSYNWQQISWTIEHGTISYGAGSTSIGFNADGSGQPVVLHVHVQDYSACEADATSSVSIRTISAPPIQVMYPSMCANGYNNAYINGPSDGSYNWQQVTWTIEHGTITYGAGSTSIGFNADGSGQPVVLHVHVKDYSYCEADATSSVSIRTISAPPIQVMYPSMCANGYNNAYINGPSDGSYNWQQVTWTIEHGTITYGAGSTSIGFNADGSGQLVVLHVHVKDYSYCEADASASVSVRTIAAPPIQLMYPTMCANGYNNAYISGPADGSYNWQQVTWTIEHGTISYGAGSTSIGFSADGSGQPVVLHVHVRDYSYCEAEATSNLSIRTITTPAIQAYPSSLCPGGYGYATVAAPPQGGNWQYVQWTVLNGTIMYGQGSSSVSFVPDNSGQPITLRATVQDYSSCTATAELSVPVTGDVLAIQLGSATLSAGVPATASIPATFASQNWYVSHATVTGDSTGPTLSFTPDGTGAVAFSVYAVTAAGCYQYAGQTVTLDNAPLMIEAPLEYCMTNDHNADIYPSSGVTNVQWSITNGTITNGANAYKVTFHPPGGADTTLTVTATLPDGTSHTATHVVRYHLPVLDIDAPASYCPGTSLRVRLRNIPDFIPGGGFQTDHPGAATVHGNFDWEFDTTGFSGPVVVTGTFYTADGCTVTGTVTVQPADAVQPSVAVSGNLCLPGGVTLTATPAGASYLWSTGATTQSINVTVQGTYSVAVTPATGCTRQASATVTSTYIPTPSITAGGPTSFCSGGSVTLTAPGGYASYLWSNGATTQSITTGTAGSYAVTVADANMCSATSSPTVVTVQAAPAATITPSGPTTWCGYSTVTLTASAGTSYHWSTGETTQAITTYQSGSFSVTVTGANGCSTTSAPTVVTANPDANAAIVTEPEWTYGFCRGGSVTLKANTFTPNPTYRWSTGETTDRITVTNGGDYTVTVTSAQGCSVTTAPYHLTVVEPFDPVVITPSATSTCSGKTVRLTVTTANPGQYPGFIWNDGYSTISTYRDVGPGTWSVTARSVYGCEATSAPVTIANVGSPDTTITASGPTTFCQGDSVTLTAPAGMASYLWSNGTTSRSLTTPFSGTYSVTVTTADGCRATSQPVTVTATQGGPNLSISYSGTLTVCPGGSRTLTANAAGATGYLWSTGETTQSITVTAPGTYGVRASNASGCSYQAVTLAAAPAPTATITAGGPLTFCGGGHVLLTANSGSAYHWSNGATTQSLDVQYPGTYSVTVTDVNGCAATSTPVTVNVNYAPSAYVTLSPSSVFFASNTYCEGTPVTISANPNAVSYLWSTGATTSSIVVTTGGNYTVTLTGSNGCSTSQTVSVSYLSAPKPVVTAIGSTHSCAPAHLTAADTGALSYQWQERNRGYVDISQVLGHPLTLDVFQTGDYQLIARYQYCTIFSDFVHVDISPAPAVSINPFPAYICPGGGTVTLTTTDNPPAGTTYLWSTGETTPQITVSAAGTYSLTTTSPDGCTYNTSVSVYVRSMTTPVITPFGSTTFCAGGSVLLNSNYQGSPGIVWSNGATTGSITVTQSGTYTFTVTDSNGCTATSAPVTVTVTPGPPTPVVTASGPTTFCSGGSVTLTAPAGYSSYYWSNGAGSQSITVNYGGNFNVRVTGANGCTSTSADTSVTVLGSPGIPTVTASGPTTFCAGGNVTLTAPAGFSSYAWSNGATTQSITVNTSGSYTVAVTNANGCSATSAPTAVTVNPLPAPAITAGGPTTFCAGGSVTLTASNASSYLWSTGATTRTITVSASGSYSVTATDANGCSATSSPAVVTVNALPTPTISASGPTTFCAGGSVVLTASSGASYLWSNGATTPSITATAAGNYHVTVTDANGCSATSADTAVVVTGAPSPSITPGGNVSICAPGYVILSANPGSGLTYLWSTGETTQTIQVYAAGSYTVTETNSNGCSATSSPTVVTVKAAAPKPVITPSGSTTLCPGASVTLTASSGFASYHWSNGATTQSIVVTGAGGFNVIGYNENGCGAYSDSVFVSTATPTTPTVTANGPTTFCAGGSVTLTAPGGYSSYAWSNGATTSSITVSASGSYTVTTTDASGCSASSAPKVVTVNAAPAVPVISPGGPTSFCPGGSVTLTAPAGYSSYSWSNGSSSQAITVSTAGSYSVTVRNTSGCATMSAPVAVSVYSALPTPDVAHSGPTNLCPGGSVTFTAPDGFTYLWSTGETTQSIVANATGAYRVVVTDANGCSATSSWYSVLVNAAPPTPVINAGGPTTFCAGGSVTLTAPDPPSGYTYYYLWSTGATTKSVTVATSGNYSVTVTDVNGCSATSAATTVTANANPTATIAAGGPTTFCAGASVTLTASSGSSYLWSTGATTQSITVGTSGNYSVTVTNANGCSATSAATTVTAIANPTATIAAGGPTTFCAGGSVTLTASSGSSYLWSTGATTSSITVSTSGNYSVTVTSANGCSATSAATTVTANANPAATITAGGPTTFCAGGSVTLTASSGSSYLWSTGATTQSITVSSAGSYSVTVTSASGCSATSASTTVTLMSGPATNISSSSGSYCQGSSVTLTGSGATSYLWSTGATTPSISVSSAGDYYVIGTGANGCSTQSGTIHIGDPTPLPTPTITAGGPTTFCAGGSVTLSAPAGFNGYSWSNGATSQSITVSASGSYTVTVMNAAGCSGTSAPTVVTANANPAATITAGGPTTFCAGGSVTLTAPAGFTYAWSTGATTQSITANASGNYSVTVTNANGCSATSAATTVTANANPTATVTAGGPTTFCTGGSVTLTASAGSSYLWSTGATTQAITVSASGSYSVTVTNANGCSATSAATAVTVNTKPATPTITAGGPTTFCAGGSVTLTAPAGFTYLWNTGATTQSISVTASGNYTVTVTNANGCSAMSAPTAVTVNPAPSITAFNPTSQTVQRNRTPTAITVTASGTGTKTYQWYAGSSGTTTNPISGATGTSYSPPTSTKGTFTYWVRVSIGSCTADSATATVVVN